VFPKPLRNFALLAIPVNKLPAGAGEARRGEADGEARGGKARGSDEEGREGAKEEVKRASLRWV